MVASIDNFREKIKAAARAIPHSALVAVLIVLVAVTSFGLGRLSTIGTQTAPVTVTQPAGAPSTTPHSPGGLFVGSRYSSVYHFPWCAGAERIKQANAVWFTSEEDARAAGYRPAQNCPGLTP